MDDFESKDIYLRLPVDVFNALCAFSDNVQKKTHNPISIESAAIGLIITGLVQGKYLNKKIILKELFKK